MWRPLLVDGTNQSSLLFSIICKCKIDFFLLCGENWPLCLFLSNGKSNSFWKSSVFHLWSLETVDLCVCWNLTASWLCNRCLAVCTWLCKDNSSHARAITEYRCGRDSWPNSRETLWILQINEWHLMLRRPRQAMRFVVTRCTANENYEGTRPNAY